MTVKAVAKSLSGNAAKVYPVAALGGLAGYSFQAAPFSWETMANFVLVALLPVVLEFLKGGNQVAHRWQQLSSFIDGMQAQANSGVDGLQELIDRKVEEALAKKLADAPVVAKQPAPKSPARRSGTVKGTK